MISLLRVRKSVLHVLIATPYGRGGKGGIDRIMDGLRKVLDQNPKTDTTVSFGATRGPGLIALSPLYLFVFILKIMFLRCRTGTKVIHLNLSVHGSTWRKLILARVARTLGIPYVIHLHGGRYRQFWLSVPYLIQREIYKMFSSAARIIVLGNIWRDFVREFVPALDEKISVLPNATSCLLPSQRTIKDETIILFLGKICDLKGVPHLLRALHGLCPNPPWRAVIAGNGDLSSAWDLIEHLGISRHVSLPGWVDDQEVKELLLYSHILVLPSFVENLPMSVIEGMAAGLAVIATPVGAVEDVVIHGKTGLLVPPGDVHALTHSLQLLINEPLYRQKLGKAAVDFHNRNLEINDYAKKLLKLWSEVAV